VILHFGQGEVAEEGKGREGKGREGNSEERRGEGGRRRCWYIYIYTCVCVHMVGQVVN
jgi:hypothetical protein